MTNDMLFALIDTARRMPDSNHRRIIASVVAGGQMDDPLAMPKKPVRRHVGETPKSRNQRVQKATAKLRLRQLRGDA